MTAKEAAELSTAYSKYNEEVGHIKAACERGERSLKTYFTKDSAVARQLFIQNGFKLSDIIDEDSDYRGTTISW